MDTSIMNFGDTAVAATITDKQASSGLHGRASARLFLLPVVLPYDYKSFR